MITALNCKHIFYVGLFYMLAYTVNVLAVFNVEFLLLFYKVKNGEEGVTNHFHLSP